MSSIEQRRAPRFETNFSAIVTTAYRESEPCVVSNISEYGLQLTGNGSLMQTLYPNFKRPDYHVPIAVMVNFEVPTHERKAAPVSLECQLVYCRRCAQDLFKVGCDFASMSEESEEALSDFIRYIALPSYPRDHFLQ